VFQGFKSAFNTQKVCLKKKKYLFDKKIKSAFKGKKNLKMVKTNFWQKLKSKAFTQKLFLTSKLYFSNTCFFNNRDKVGINNINNSRASHMLLKN
jgi:hypothetical protein